MYIELESKSILKELVALKEDINNKKHFKYNRSKGICFNFEQRTGQALYKVLTSVGIDWVNWPSFSGLNVYPVTNTQDGVTPDEEYWRCPDKYVGAYGELRLQLLDWLIEQFENKLKVY